MKDMSTTSFHVSIEKISEGYLGKCIEFPSVVVYGDTSDQVLSEAQKALNGYFIAFPEELETLDQKQEQIKHIPIEC